MIERRLCQSLRRFSWNQRLDGNTDQGDKAAHENVFRHLWHLHYWLASRWSGRFRLIFPQIGQTPRPAGWSPICASARLGSIQTKSSEPGRHGMSDASQGLRLYNTLTRTKENFV